jgi:isoleucyl-tRNA synthetase
LHKLKLNIEKINNDYKKFNYIDIIETTNNHVLDLSAGYFNIIKDALYCNEKDDQRRRTIQTVLFHILNAYLILLAPILVHTTEEAYQVFNKPDKKESIHLEDTIVALDVEFQEPNMKK